MRRVARHGCDRHFTTDMKTMSEPRKIKFFACRNSRYLAEKIAKHYGSELGNSVVLEFSDGEFQPAYDESIRGCTVFVVGSTFPPEIGRAHV